MSTVLHFIVDKTHFFHNDGELWLLVSAVLEGFDLLVDCVVVTILTIHEHSKSIVREKRGTCPLRPQSWPQSWRSQFLEASIHKYCYFLDRSHYNIITASSSCTSLNELAGFKSCPVLAKVDLDFAILRRFNAHFHRLLDQSLPLGRELRKNLLWHLVACFIHLSILSAIGCASTLNRSLRDELSIFDRRLIRALKSRSLSL